MATMQALAAGYNASWHALTDGYRQVDGADVELIARHVIEQVHERLPRGWHWLPHTSELLVPEGDADDESIPTLLDAIDRARETVDLEDARWFA